jgi:hypothetical protein
MWIECSENWWKKTANPLHVWRVISICLNALPPHPIPDWCIPYLAETDLNITLLTRGRDFRGDRPAVSPNQACDLLSRAMGLSRQGQKNAFAKNAEHSRDQRHVNAAEFRGHDAAEVIASERVISKDRAKRRVSEVKRVMRRG